MDYSERSVWETSTSDNIISPTSYRLHKHLHIFGSKGYFQDACIESSRTQASGRGPTFSITRGSFFATAGGVASGVDSGDDDDDDDDVSASPTGRL